MPQVHYQLKTEVCTSLNLFWYSILLDIGWKKYSSSHSHNFIVKFNPGQLLHNTPSQFIFANNIARDEVYHKNFTQPFPTSPSPWVAPKNCLFPTITQSWTLTNFLHNTPSQVHQWRSQEVEVGGQNWGRSPNRGHGAPENWGRSQNRGWSPRFSGGGSGVWGGGSVSPSPETFWKFVLETVHSGV